MNASSETPSPSNHKIAQSGTENGAEVTMTPHVVRFSLFLCGSPTRFVVASKKDDLIKRERLSLFTQSGKIKIQKLWHMAISEFSKNLDCPYRLELFNLYIWSITNYMGFRMRDDFITKT